MSTFIGTQNVKHESGPKHEKSGILLILREQKTKSISSLFATSNSDNRIQSVKK